MITTFVLAVGLLWQRFLHLHHRAPVRLRQVTI